MFCGYLNFIFFHVIGQFHSKLKQSILPLLLFNRLPNMALRMQ